MGRFLDLLILHFMPPLCNILVFLHCASYKNCLLLRTGTGMVLERYGWRLSHLIRLLLDHRLHTFPFGLASYYVVKRMEWQVDAVD